LNIRSEKLTLTSFTKSKNCQNIRLQMLLYIKNRVISLFFILGLCLISFSESGFTQDILQQAPNDTTKVIAAIPVSNIGIETETTLNKIREIRDKIQPSKLDLEIDSLIPLEKEFFNQEKESLDLNEIEYMDLRQTEEIKNEFSQMRTQFDGWRNNFMDKTKEINNMKMELVHFKTAWEKTLALERKEQLPIQVNDRIKNNLKEITDLDKILTDKSNVLLTRQDELTEMLIYIDDVISTVTKIQESLRTNLLSVNSPPIWHIFMGVSKNVMSKERISKIVKRHNVEIKNFITNYKSKIIYQLFFFVFLLFIFYFLKRDVAKWSDERKDELVKTSLFIISKPISSAFIITLLVTNLFYPDAPREIIQYFNTFLIIPILTLGPGLIRGIRKKYFYIVIGVFILSQAKEYYSDLVILERILLLLIDVTTIVLSIKLIQKKHDITEVNPGANWDFIITIIRMGVLFLGIAIIANIFGGIDLAKVMSRGSLIMLYGGGTIYVCTIILKGMFALLLQHQTISSLSMIQNYADVVKKRVFQIIKWAAILYWIYFTFSAFLIYEPIYIWLSAFLSNEWKIGSIVITLGSLLAFFFTFWIALSISKFIRFILQDEIFTYFELPRGVPGAISMLVRLTLIGIGFILALGAAKIDMSNIAIVFGALGVGIGFGLQNIFNNLVSGLILAFERPIQVGDIIQIATLNLMGEVKEIGIRASIVRTFDGAEVIVPNGNLISNEMINWTLSDHRRRQEILVGVAYGTETNKVVEILDQVVSVQDHILKNPPHVIIFNGFGESSLDFRVLFWTQFDDGLTTKSAVGLAIDDAFKKAGIEIPFPQRDLHLRSTVDGLASDEKENKDTKAVVSKKNTTNTKQKPENLDLV